MAAEPGRCRAVGGLAAVAGARLSFSSPAPVGDLPSSCGWPCSIVPSRRLHRHGRRLDEGPGVRGRRRGSPLRRRSPDLRRGDPRPRRGRPPSSSRAQRGSSRRPPSTAPERLRLVHGLVGRSAARPVAIGPEAHDRLVAVTSHLPHVLANVLLNQAGSARIDGHDPLQAAGGSLRDMTRIGGANPRIWVDIFLDNREALAGPLAEQRRLLEQVERALAAGDAGFLARWIGEASGHRRRMLATAFTDPGQLHRLRIHVSDRPGVLAGIFQALGAERINVEDFELDHVSGRARAAR